MLFSIALEHRQVLGLGLALMGLPYLWRLFQRMRAEQRASQDAWDREQIARYQASLKLFNELRAVREGRKP